MLRRKARTVAVILPFLLITGCVSDPFAEPKSDQHEKMLRSHDAKCRTWAEKRMASKKVKWLSYFMYKPERKPWRSYVVLQNKKGSGAAHICTENGGAGMPTQLSTKQVRAFRRQLMTLLHKDIGDQASPTPTEMSSALVVIFTDNGGQPKERWMPKRFEPAIYDQFAGAI